MINQTGSFRKRESRIMEVLWDINLDFKAVNCLSLSLKPQLCLSQWDKGLCVGLSQSRMHRRGPRQLISCHETGRNGMVNSWWRDESGSKPLLLFLSSYGWEKPWCSLQQGELGSFCLCLKLYLLFQTVWRHYHEITSAFIFQRIGCQNNLCKGSMLTLPASFQFLIPLEWYPRFGRSKQCLSIRKKKQVFHILLQDWVSNCVSLYVHTEFRSLISWIFGGWCKMMLKNQG